MGRRLAFAAAVFLVTLVVALGILREGWLGIVLDLELHDATQQSRVQLTAVDTSGPAEAARSTGCVLDCAPSGSECDLLAERLQCSGAGNTRIEVRHSGGALCYTPLIKHGRTDANFVLEAGGPPGWSVDVEGVVEVEGDMYGFGSCRRFNRLLTEELAAALVKERQKRLR